SAQRAVRSWLKLATSARTSTDLIGAQDDTMAIGARKAFEEISDQREQQRWLGLPFTGCDGQPATGQAWVRNGMLAATIYIPAFAGRPIKTLVNAIKAENHLPKSVPPNSY